MGNHSSLFLRRKPGLRTALGTSAFPSIVGPGLATGLVPADLVSGEGGDEGLAGGQVGAKSAWADGMVARQ
jgi:hypothetical protein